MAPSTDLRAEAVPLEGGQSMLEPLPEAAP